MSLYIRRRELNRKEAVNRQGIIADSGRVRNKVNKCSRKPYFLDRWYASIHLCQGVILVVRIVPDMMMHLNKFLAGSALLTQTAEDALRASSVPIRLLEPYP